MPKARNLTTIKLRRLTLGLTSVIFLACLVTTAGVSWFIFSTLSPQALADEAGTETKVEVEAVNTMLISEIEARLEKKIQKAIPPKNATANPFKTIEVPAEEPAVPAAEPVPEAPNEPEPQPDTTTD